MTADRTDSESDDDAEPSASADDESDSVTVPSVATEDAGSGLWSDLKADSTDESIDMPGVSSDVNSGGEANEPDIDLSEVPNDLIETFVAVVVALNGAILGLSLGVLFFVFDGATTRSAALLAGGVLLFAFAVRRYRQYRDSSDASSENDDGDTGDESNPGNDGDRGEDADGIDSETGGSGTDDAEIEGGGDESEPQTDSS